MELAKLGECIKNARKEKGLSQEDLATKAHVSRKTISMLETGVFYELGIRRIERICSVVGLGLSVGSFKMSENAAAEEAALAFEAGNEADEKIEKARRGFRQ